MPSRWSRPLARLFPAPPRRPAPARWRPAVEPLESRSTPAVVATLSAGVLTVTLNAPADTVSVVGTDAGGAAFEVTGTGLAATPFTGVTSIAVSDTGVNAGQSVTFDDDADGAVILTGALTTSGVETVTVDTANGPVRAASFSAALASASIRLNAGVTTTAAAGQSYGGPVVLGAPTVTLSAGAAGGVSFAATVNAATAGTDGLVVNAGGQTNFGGAVGGAAALGALTTDTPGTTVLNANVTANAQTYNDPLTVGAGAVTVASTASGAIAFNGSVNGRDGQTNALTVNTAGTTTFAGNVGGVVPLGALTTDAPGTTAVGANVTTSGSQTYGDPVTVSGGSRNLATTNNGAVFFAGTLDAATAGGSGLTVTAGGTTTFGGTVGGTAALATLTTDAAGSTVIGLGTGTVQLRTTGNQQYNDALRLAATTVEFVSTANGGLTVSGSLNGTAGIASAVAFNTGGATTLNGVIGATTAPASLTTDAAGTTVVGNTVTTSTGNQTYNDPVTITPATGVTAVALTAQGGGALAFADTLGGASAVPVNLQAGGNLSLAKNVTFTANGSQLTAQAGAFAIASGVTVRADRQQWRAGTGAAGSTAAADLRTNTPAFRDAAGSSAPRQFVFRQDAAVTDAALPAVAQFGGTPPADYKIVSDNGTVTLANGAAVAGAGTTALTLAGTGVSVGGAIAAPAATVRLRATNGSVNQTAGGITAAALAAQATAGVDLGGPNAVPTFAARTTGGNLRYTSTVPFTVGTVASDPVITGLTATSGATAPGGTTTFSGNGGSVLDLTIAAPVGGTSVTALGSGGNDRVAVNYTLGATLANGLLFNGLGGTDALSLTDVGGSATHTYVINNNVVRDGAPAVTFTDLETLSVTAGNLADTFTVTPAKQNVGPGQPPPIEGLAGPQLTLAGGGPTGTTGDTLTFNPAGTPTFTSTTGIDGISGTASFQQPLVGGGFIQSVAFSQMEAVNPRADIRVTVTTPATTAPGETATFTVVVSNLGPAAATGVQLTGFTLTGLTNGSFTTTATAGASANPAQGSVGAFAGVPFSTLTIPANGSVTFTVTGTTGTSGSASLAVTASGAGDALDADLTNNSATATTTVAPVELVAVGAGPGGGPQVRVFNADGTDRFSFFAYDPNYRGGVTVATGDVTGDGVEDIVTGSAAGASHVKVFDGRSGAEVASFFAFPGFTGGVNVAVADGRVVVGAGPGGGPVIKGFTLAGGGATEVYSVLAFEETFRGGVRVAGEGDFLSAGAGAGGGPRVRVFRAADLPGGADAAQVTSFFAFPAGTTSGISVGMGTANGRPVVYAGTGAGSVPVAATFDALTGAANGSVQAFDATFRGEVRVAGATTTAGQPATVLAAGPGGAPRVRVHRQDGSAVFDLFAFDPSFTGGVFVG
ncbi:MAG: DUF11 domain-containing protein [Gemmataceae bacterium]|nr:DUF11 domain-containing protein [Gemmataceae bacterium]